MSKYASMNQDYTKLKRAEPSDLQEMSQPQGLSRDDIMDYFGLGPKKMNVWDVIGGIGNAATGFAKGYKGEEWENPYEKERLLQEQQQQKIFSDPTVLAARGETNQMFPTWGAAHPGQTAGDLFGERMTQGMQWKSHGDSLTGLARLAAEGNEEAKAAIGMLGQIYQSRLKHNKTTSDDESGIPPSVLNNP